MKVSRNCRKSDLKGEELLKWVDEELKKLYPPFRLKKRPFSEVMIKTILSQNTNDTLRDRAYRKLKKAFPTLEDIEKAPVEQLVETVKVCGLPHQKVAAIKNYLAWLRRRFGTLHPRGICNLSPDELLKELKGIKGIGEKTARVAMLFGCGHKVFPVDTHIYRVARRLGLIPQNASREQAHLILEDLSRHLDPAPLHLNIISFGREICTARKPLCSQCPLSSRCPSGGKD